MLFFFILLTHFLLVKSNVKIFSLGARKYIAIGQNTGYDTITLKLVKFPKDGSLFTERSVNETEKGEIKLVDSINGHFSLSYSITGGTEIYFGLSNDKKKTKFKINFLPNTHIFQLQIVNKSENSCIQSQDGCKLIKGKCRILDRKKEKYLFCYESEHDVGFCKNTYGKKNHSKEKYINPLC